MSEDSNKEPQYSLLTALGVLLAGLALLTLIPHASSVADLVGLHTLCSFAPISTLILLGVGGFAIAMRNAMYKARPRPPLR
jgi:zinc transporter ZupT